MTPVKAPFLTGQPYDSAVPKAALAVFGGLAAAGFGYLMLGSAMMFDSLPLRLVLNLSMLAVVLLLFYMSGSSNGSNAVNLGEIMYRRQETDRPATQQELAMCYHPLKGFVIGLLGSAPLFLLALVFAVIARRQMASMGVLPSWVGGVQAPDAVNALAAYNVGEPLGLEGALRIVIRLSLMPIVNIIGSEKADALLLLERLSPLLVLLPGAAYGVGYTQGVSLRTQVHTSIAQNKRKAARKARRARRAKETARRGPEQLN